MSEKKEEKTENGEIMVIDETSEFIPSIPSSIKDTVGKEMGKEDKEKEKKQKDVKYETIETFIPKINLITKLICKFVDIVFIRIGVSKLDEKEVSSIQDFISTIKIPVKVKVDTKKVGNLSKFISLIIEIILPRLMELGTTSIEKGLQVNPR